LMACFDRIGDPADPLTVLVATSGDTGGAIGCAAEGRRGVRSAILYPPSRVSPFQRLQLSCWAAPNLSLEVDGDFDDCQRLVKTAFADPALAAVRAALLLEGCEIVPRAAYEVIPAMEQAAIAAGYPQLV